MIDTSLVENTIKWQLFNYQKSKELIHQFEEDCLTGKGQDDVGTPIQNKGHISDPTMRAAMLMLNPPKHIATARRWVSVIDHTWEEFKTEDAVAGRENGIAFLFERAYYLTGEPRRKEDNAANRDMICEECQIAKRTFYTWLSRCVQTTLYFAAKEGLV